MIKDVIKDLMIKYFYDVYNLLMDCVKHPDAPLNQYRKDKSEIIFKMITDLDNIVYNDCEEDQI